MKSKAEKEHERAVRETITVRGHELLPTDAIARRVTQPGIHYEPEFTPDDAVWDIPPATVPPPQNPDMKDITGTRRGKVTIVGYLSKDNVRTSTAARKRGGSAWLARCDCGRYIVRRYRAWRKGLAAETPDSGCPRCHYLTEMRRNEERYRNGDNPEYHSHGPLAKRGGVRR